MSEDAGKQIRQDIEVIPADNPKKLKLKWKVYEKPGVTWFNPKGIVKRTRSRIVGKSFERIGYPRFPRGHRYYLADLHAGYPLPRTMKIYGPASPGYSGKGRHYCYGPGCYLTGYMIRKYYKEV